LYRILGPGRRGDLAHLWCFGITKDSIFHAQSLA
jgi:hypothetical protein